MSHYSQMLNQILWYRNLLTFPWIHLYQNLYPTHSTPTWERHLFQRTFSYRIAHAILVQVSAYIPEEKEEASSNNTCDVKLTLTRELTSGNFFIKQVKRLQSFDSRFTFRCKIRVWAQLTFDLYLSFPSLKRTYGSLLPKMTMNENHMGNSRNS